VVMHGRRDTFRPQSPHPPFGHLLPTGEGDGADGLEVIR
jgi:hypothetical protein